MLFQLLSWNIRSLSQIYLIVLLLWHLSLMLIQHVRDRNMRTFARYLIVIFLNIPVYMVLFQIYKESYNEFRGKYSEDTFKYKLEMCKCHRQLPKTIYSDQDTILFRNTTCGRDAFMRGSHQKVAAFSFYGGGFDPQLTKTFFEGLKRQLILI